VKIRPLTVEGAYEITPQQHGDPRGLFLEWYRFDRLAEVVGHPLRLAQANMSVSARDDAAPGLAAAREGGLLPAYDACRDYVAGLRTP
jgi:dTDP-4-dehydrorhamnose 3,5-epimerase-like enzyme